MVQALYILHYTCRTRIKKNIQQDKLKKNIPTQSTLHFSEVFSNLQDKNQKHNFTQTNICTAKTVSFAYPPFIRANPLNVL